MDSNNLNNIGKVVWGIIMLFFGILILSVTLFLGFRLIDEYFCLICLSGLLGSSFFISKGIGFIFCKDELEEDIVVNGQTSYRTKITKKYLIRKMITYFIDSFITLIFTILCFTACISPVNIFIGIIAVILFITFLLIALATRGDLKKYKGE